MCSFLLSSFSDFTQGQSSLFLSPNSLSLNLRSLFITLTLYFFPSLSHHYLHVYIQLCVLSSSLFSSLPLFIFFPLSAITIYMYTHNYMFVRLLSLSLSIIFPSIFSLKKSDLNPAVFSSEK